MYKKNRILSALRQGEVALGMELYTGNPSLVEILAKANFDFYMIDMEHAPVDYNTMNHLIRAGDAAGITTVVRVAENNASQIGHSIEAGAQGIIVPNIQNKEDARKAVNAVRYPPEGTAGSCPAIRAANYSIANWDDYLRNHSEEVSLNLIIEDVEGVKNMEEIFAELKPETDIVSFGRGDYAQSLTNPGEDVDWNHPAVMEAFDKILAESEKTGIHTMFVPWPEVSPENAYEMIKKGSRVCLYSIDQLLFYNLCRDAVNGIKALTKNEG